jgi:hypothetical protein
MNLTQTPPPELIDLDDLHRRHVTNVRELVANAVAHHEGTLDEIVVVATISALVVMPIDAFIRWAARRAKTDANTLAGRLSVARGTQGNRVTVVTMKADGSITFSTAPVARLQLALPQSETS